MRKVVVYPIRIKKGKKNKSGQTSAITGKGYKRSQTLFCIAAELDQGLIERI